MTYAVLLIIYFMGFITGGVSGYMIGFYRERKKWNKLIDDGILPKPKSKQ